MSTSLVMLWGVVEAQGAATAIPQAVTGHLVFSGKTAAGVAYTVDEQVTLYVGAVTLPTPLPDPKPQPDPKPAPGPGTSVDRVTNASGASITGAVGGSAVYIKGSGMGTGGTVQIAGQACKVLDWAPWQAAVTLPAVAVSQTGPVVVTPAGLAAATSPFSFTIRP